MKKYLIYLTIACLTGFGFYQKIYIPKHTFKTTQVGISNMDVIINGVGNVDSKDIYKIGSIYGGKVLSFKVEEGKFIKKGTVIAKIDSVDLNDKIAELDASIKKIHNDIKSLKLEKQSATVQYKYQKDIYTKNKQLYTKGAISQLDFKKYKTNKETSNIQVNTISSKIDSLYSQISQIKASLNGLKEKLKRYTIISPIDGYITKKYISNFAIINPNQTLIDIVNPKDVWIATHIDTRISGDVKIGDTATIQLRSSSKKYSAKVTNIKPINNSVTNEREIDVSFDNLPIPFYLEEQAIVNININKLKNTIKIPTKAVTLYKQKDGVWMVKNNKVQFKAIKILAYDDKFIATKDIQESDILVIPNPSKKSLSNGVKIYHD